MALRKNPAPEVPEENEGTTTQASRSENVAKVGGGIDSPETLDVEQGGTVEGADESEGTRGFVAPTDDAEAANSATAPRNSGGALTDTGIGSEADAQEAAPVFSNATAPTADPSIKTNMHESIPTHTTGMGDYDATVNSGVPVEGEQVKVRVDPDYYDPKVVLDLNDPVATQIAHLNGGSIAAVGEGRRVDPRTITGGENIWNVVDQSQLGKVKEGERFYALWLFNPGSDSIRWYREQRAELISGRLIRNGLPASYWRDHAMNRPPLCERTAEGFTILD